MMDRKTIKERKKGYYAAILDLLEITSLVDNLPSPPTTIATEEGWQVGDDS